MHDDLSSHRLLAGLPPIEHQTPKERDDGVLLLGCFCRSLGTDLIMGTSSHDLLYSANVRLVRVYLLNAIKTDHANPLQHGHSQLG